MPRWPLLALSLLSHGCARPPADRSAPPSTASPIPPTTASPTAVTPAVDAATIARWSAARTSDELIALTRATEDHAREARGADVRAAAIAALGRVGDPAAVARLLERTRAPEAATRTQAASALAIAAALGSPVGDAEIHLLAAWRLADPRARADLATALARLGSAAAVPVLASGVDDPDPALAEAAAIALGVLGRRGIAWDDQAERAVLALAARASEPAHTYAAAYALAHAPAAAPREAIAHALLQLARATDPETRGVALVGLARRKLPASQSRAALAAALTDVNPWVQVAAVRGLLALADDAASLAVLTWARAQVDRGVLDDPTRAAAAHPVLEAFERLTAARDRPAPPPAKRRADPLAATPPKSSRADPLASATPPKSSRADPLASATPPKPPVRPERAAQWTRELLAAQREVEARLARAPAGSLLARAACQLAAAAAREDRWRPPLRCPERFPAAERRVLTAGVLGAGFGGRDRREFLQHDLFTDADPRVRAAAVTAAAALRPVEPAAVDLLWLQALRDPASVVVGAAADVLAAQFTATSEVPPPAPTLLAAVVARARDELTGEVELYAGLAAALTAIGDRTALPACSDGLRHSSPAVRDAARACVTRLRGDPGPQTPAKAPALPPHDPADVLGERVLWRLTTARGVLVIELDPAAAPWSVATLVALTRRGFYDGLVFHRVVPGFVVQGGDPQGTGWGGPGFGLPSEPTSGRFERGAVGIADAGKDSGGSQFFIMHARAPHLEGRYTRVGEVRGGLDVADALQLGDRIVKAEVTLE